MAAVTCVLALCVLPERRPGRHRATRAGRHSLGGALAVVVLWQADQAELAPALGRAA
ncbi:Alpha-1,6-mannosyltransferase OS=Streptomyces violarus OX=67380 GN=FHS41_005319 PE=4 SV=1 [Streptomyces violarus]